MSLALIAHAAAASTAKSSGSSSYIFLILIVVYAAVYFLYIRPRTQKARAARATGSHVEVGDKVVTIGGLVGTVTSIEGDIITLASDNGNELQYLKRAISQKYVAPGTVEAEPDQATEPPANEGDPQ